jgi:multidrug efflux pump subunit AcrA (membrane-fusion protein)
MIFVIFKECKMEKRKKKGAKKAALVLGSVFAALALIAGPGLLASGNESKAVVENAEQPVFAVRTENAEKRTLRAALEVNGDIVSAQEAGVFPYVAGKVSRVYVDLGSPVRKGDVIAEVDPSKPGAAYMKSPVYAPISGVVSKTPLSAGATVGESDSIATISASGHLELRARIPEREIAALEPSLAAEVSLQAYPGEIFSATVARVSPVLDAASRTKLITLNFTHNDSRINAGMFARIRLNTRTYSDVLTVPAEAVVNKHGESAVFVARNDGTGLTAERRVIESGVTLDGWTEIRSGLEEGEAVIAQGQRLLRGGEAVRVIAGSVK